VKRDLYADVSARIVAELECGAAPWVKPWSATAGINTPCNAVSNRPYSGCNVVLLWMAQAAGYRTARYLTFKQAVELGSHVRKGERGTKIYFVKQLEVRDKDGADTGEENEARLVPMLREYTVFDVDQCENLPPRVTTPNSVTPRNRDERDATIDEFLACGSHLRAERLGTERQRSCSDFASRALIAGCLLIQMDPFTVSIATHSTRQI
jgi:antirestriction protein ArdC